MLVISVDECAFVMSGIKVKVSCLASSVRVTCGSEYEEMYCKALTKNIEKCIKNSPIPTHACRQADI